jgi:hypothetical protein
MTALAAGRAYILRNFTLTIGMTDFANAATTASLKPESKISTLTTLVPNGVIQDKDTTIWTFSLAGVSDWTSGGLAKLLNDNDGLNLDAVLKPKAGSGLPSAAFTFIGSPVQFGGDQGSWNTFASQDFALVGPPVFDDGESS